MNYLLWSEIERDSKTRSVERVTYRLTGPGTQYVEETLATTAKGLPTCLQIKHHGVFEDEAFGTVAVMTLINGRGYYKPSARTWVVPPVGAIKKSALVGSADGRINHVRT